MRVLPTQSCREGLDVRGVREGEVVIMGESDGHLRSLLRIITRWGKLLDSDWLRHCEFIRNLRANYRSQGQNL